MSGGGDSAASACVGWFRGRGMLGSIVVAGARQGAPIRRTDKRSVEDSEEEEEEGREQQRQHDGEETRANLVGGL